MASAGDRDAGNAEGVRPKLQRRAVGDAVRVERPVAKLGSAEKQPASGSRGGSGVAARVRHKQVARIPGAHLLQLRAQRRRGLVRGEAHLQVLRAAHLDDDVRALAHAQANHRVVGQPLLGNRRRVIQRAPRVRGAQIQGGFARGDVQKPRAVRLEQIRARGERLDVRHGLRLVQRKPVLALARFAVVANLRRGADADVPQVAQLQHQLAVLRGVLHRTRRGELVDLGQVRRLRQEQRARRRRRRRVETDVETDRNRLRVRRRRRRRQALRRVAVELERQRGHDLVAEHLDGRRGAVGEEHADVRRRRRRRRRRPRRRASLKARLFPPRRSSDAARPRARPPRSGGKLNARL
mmetsp:Transcript_14243/g.60980  ORF Transcript_14243/g.60980 Transcript_14243/m.60980 type:complete len:352 (-) Transcript_14243:2956-4011(-)